MRRVRILAPERQAVFSGMGALLGSFWEKVALFLARKVVFMGWVWVGFSELEGAGRGWEVEPEGLRKRSLGSFGKK